MFSDLPYIWKLFGYTMLVPSPEAELQNFIIQDGLQYGKKRLLCLQFGDSKKVNLIVIDTNDQTTNFGKDI